MPHPDGIDRRTLLAAAASLTAAPAGAQGTASTGAAMSETTAETAHGRVLAMPYSVELNDIPMMMVQHHAASEFETRCMDYFERVYAEGEKRPKVMAIAVHPYISGVPHRIKYLEAIYDYVRRFDGVLHWTGAQILDWYKPVANVKFR